MTVNSVWAVQAGVYACLSANSELVGLLGNGASGVLDHVPPGTVAPYVVMGEIAARPVDACDAAGMDIGLTVHVYSRGSGMKELRAVMAAVYAALHDAGLVVSGHDVALCQCTGLETRMEGDGVTRHGTLRFRIVVSLQGG